MFDNHNCYRNKVSDYVLKVEETSSQAKFHQRYWFKHFICSYQVLHRVLRQVLSQLMRERKAVPHDRDTCDTSTLR